MRLSRSAFILVGIVIIRVLFEKLLRLGKKKRFISINLFTLAETVSRTWWFYLLLIFEFVWLKQEFKYCLGYVKESPQKAKQSFIENGTKNL